MTVKRGDIVLARFPHASGGRGKKRPVLVVQSDVYNGRMRHMIVAEITTNLAAASDRAYVLDEIIAWRIVRNQREHVVRRSTATQFYIAREVWENNF